MKSLPRDGKTVGATDDDAAEHMADALTYLSRVAVETGYATIANDILAVRDKLQLIAQSQPVPFRERTHD